MRASTTHSLDSATTKPCPGSPVLFEVDNSLPNQTVHGDEIVEDRTSQYDYLPIITGSGFGESSVPQNIETHQKEQGGPSIFGVVLRLRGSPKGRRYPRSPQVVRA
jgi:hypothetical protein